MAVTTTTWSGPAAADAPVRSNPENSHSTWTNSWGLDNYNYHRPYSGAGNRPPASRLGAGVTNVQPSYT